MTFEDRRREFEARYVHDQELRFRIEALRAKLLGLWAAEKLGKTGADAETYAQELMKASFTHPGEEGVFQRVRADFDTGGVEQSDHQIRRHMAELLVQAESQIGHG